MLIRALALLIALVAISIVLSMTLGEKVLVALGLLFVQLQVLAKKVLALETPALLIWLKTQAALFLRIELLKKWVTTSLLPLIMGSVMRRRIAGLIDRLRGGIAARYQALIAWYGGLNRTEQVLAALIVVAATFALSVSSIGLWLILFSVKAPFWIIAVFATLGRTIWQSLSKIAFRSIAFFKLGLIWGLMQRGLPERLLEKKRRFEFRVARAVVRRRRLTLRDLETRTASLGLRWDVIGESWRQLWRRT